MCFFISLLGSSAIAREPAVLQLSIQQIGGTASLRGMAVADAETAWASGTEGTVLRTADAGTTWQKIDIPRTSELDFRDIQVLRGGEVLLMSAGPGAKSRVYRSKDNGKTWDLRLTCTDEKGFFNAFAFWSQAHGILVGDPVDGRLDIRLTDDGGLTWQSVDAKNRPELKDGEYGFAASGTNLETNGDSNAWIATGGSVSRIFRSTNRGQTWEAAASEVTSGEPSAGVFSIAFQDATHGVSIGGDYKKPEEDVGNAAFTTDGGKSWTTSKSRMPHKACVKWISENACLAAGRTGIALSLDRGLTWKPVSDESFYTLGVHRDSVSGRAIIFGAGADGRVAKMESPVK